MRDPLIPPLIAIVAGLLAGRAFVFSIREAAWPIAVFLILWAIAFRGSRWLRIACAWLAIFFTGVFAEAWHRPGAHRFFARSGTVMRVLTMIFAAALAMARFTSASKSRGSSSLSRI